jgi:diadenosine tetraphosphate (Ap4A) HIT family hydrolase
MSTTNNPSANCTICRGIDGDAEFERFQVWEDRHWRLTVSLASEVAGFAYLEPKRHIPHVTDLDGTEARTFGEVLARTTRALREETGAELVYVYVFGGGIPHFHVHLAPHRAGDALNSQIVRGELSEERLPSGVTRFTSKEFPALPEDELRAVGLRVQRRLAAGG